MDTDDKITKYDTVRIKTGEYKGKKGMVKELLGDKCIVELDDELDDVQVYLNDCSLMDS